MKTPKKEQISPDQNETNKNIPSLEGGQTSGIENKTSKKFFFERIKNASYKIVPIVVLGLIVWWSYAVMEQSKISKDFTYEPSVISLDNFYDESIGDFTGEKRGITNLSFTAEEAHSNTMSLRSVYEVRTIEGELVVSFDDLYTVDRKTGKYISEEGFDQGGVYLFAPKGLEPGDTYNYLPTNYGYPTKMNFVKEDVLFGLDVYQYESYFPEIEVDHTDFLTHVPGVGVDRGVVLDPYVRLWIEPVTGMLVDYEDGATAYYYDLATGEKIHPRNKFSNTIERSSVKERAGELSNQKTILVLVRVVAPLSLLLLVMVFYLGFYYKRKTLAKALLLFWFALIGVIFYSLFEVSDDKVFKVGISTWVHEDEFVGNIGSFKETLKNYGYVEGENIEYYLESAETNSDRQKEIALKFKEMDLDLIYSLTTTGTTIVSDVIKDVPIVFSIVSYPVESGLIHSLQNSKNNLVGSRNWVSESRQLDSSIMVMGGGIESMAFVHRAGESNSSIQFNKMLAAAEDRGIELIEVAVSSLQEMKEELDVINVDAVYTACDTLIQSGGEEVVVQYAKDKKIPSFSCGKSGVEQGSLSGLVADIDQIGHISAEKAVHILNGATPTSLETQTAARPFLFVNETTAQELGITIPQGLISEVREIFE